VVYLIFFLSGAAGLIYEIVWSRQIGLLFGHTVHAAAVVLGAYFSGMALGYLLAGRASRMLRRPLASYGNAELCVAAWALLTPWLVGLLAHPAIAGLLNNPDPSLQLAVRALAAFVILLPATVALGATLPFIAQHVAMQCPRHDAPGPAEVAPEGSGRVALAYACNTAGAFCGVLLATFVLILLLGVRESGYLAAVISAACGITALIMARHRETAPASVQEPATFAATAPQPAVKVAPQPGRADAPRPERTAFWFFLAAVSGFGTLGLEVLYTRLFALIFHNSTYTFGLVVAVVLAALSAGGWAVSSYGRRLPPSPWALHACSIGAAVVLISVALFLRATHLGYFRGAGGFTGYIAGAAGLVALVVFIPMAVLGTVMPYTWSAALKGGSGHGRVVGAMTALNTLAATLGALLTSFLLLPALGLWRCFLLLAALYVATALAALLTRYSLRSAALPLVLMVLIVAGAAQGGPSVAHVPRGCSLVFERETPYGVITVLRQESSGKLWLMENNNYTLGSNSGAVSELRMGHIPLLLHPAPHDVCFLGLATGITASAALAHPEVQHVVAVELVPAVVEAAALFADDNAGLLQQPRVELVVNDARHYLYATPRRFDVIVSDLFVPWHSETGYLYTVEHYAAARRHLKRGGMFCQWLPLYQLGGRELELIASSFASVFPCTTLWRGGFGTDGAILALIGTDEPLKISAALLDSRLSALRDARLSGDPALDGARDMVSLYAGDWPAPGPGTPLNTDDHPLVEFLAPVSQQQHVLLSGERLRRYYRETISALPTRLLTYYGEPGEPPLDVAQARARQVEAGQSEPSQ